MICPIMTAGRLAREGMSFADSGTVKCTCECMMAVKVRNETDGGLLGWRCGIVSCGDPVLTNEAPVSESVPIMKATKERR